MILLFGNYPKENYNQILSESISSAQFAADALQWSFINGLEENNQTIEIINLPFIGSYPRRYKHLYYRGCNKCLTNQGASYISYKFLNLSFIKLFTRYSITKKQLLQRGDNIFDNNENTILIYSLHTPFLKAAIEYKKKYQDTKICLIVPDLPEYMSDSKNILYRLFKFLEEKYIKKKLKDVDCFVVLSQYMILPLHIKTQNYVVIEGIYSSQEENHFYKNKFKIDDSNIKYVMYSGGLIRRYGIMNLIEAFHLLKNHNYRLILCGDGDAKEEIISFSRKDKRILYLGSLPRQEVIGLQKECTLLVNPRTNEGDFTKYSFPSKTMEYLASGTPCLIYKLDGIPKEYYEYCFTIESLNVQDLSNKINEILNLPYEELDHIGISARNFILNNKNPRIQTRKLINMIKNIQV